MAARLLSRTVEAFRQSVVWFETLQDDREKDFQP